MMYEPRPPAEWLVSVERFAELLGVTSTRVRQLSASDPLFPRPLTTGRGKLYWLPEVFAYKDSRRARLLALAHQMMRRAHG
jgi:hypothetical protein